MNKEQYLGLVDKLVARGYRKSSSSFSHADYCLYKSFHKEDNKWDNERSAYQVLLYIYDYTSRNYRNNDFYDRLPQEMKRRIDIEVHVDVSRTIEERFDLEFPIDGNESVEEIERIAEGYYNAICNLVPTPKGI